MSFTVITEFNEFAKNPYEINIFNNFYAAIKFAEKALGCENLFYSATVLTNDKKYIAIFNRCLLSNRAQYFKEYHLRGRIQ